MTRFTFIFISLLIQSLLAALSNPIDFHSQVKPIFEMVCVDCHGPEKAKASMRIDTLDPDLANGVDAEHWHLILDTINLGEMPPKKAKRKFTTAEREMVIDWLNVEFKIAKEKKKGKIRTVLRRLTPAQHSQAVQELLGLKVNYEHLLPSEGKSKEGFFNNGEVNTTSTLHIQTYIKIARKALDRAIKYGPKPEVYRYKWAFSNPSGKKNQAGNEWHLGWKSQSISSKQMRINLIPPSNEQDFPTYTPSTNALYEILRADMRGSGKYFYSHSSNGILLRSIRPHVEVAPSTWWGPSPNLKVLIRREFPVEGDFLLRVKARSHKSLNGSIENNILKPNGKPFLQIDDKKEVHIQKTLNKNVNTTVFYPHELHGITGLSISKEKKIAELDKGSKSWSLPIVINSKKKQAFQLDAIYKTAQEPTFNININGQKGAKTKLGIAKDFASKNIFQFQLEKGNNIVLIHGLAKKHIAFKAIALTSLDQKDVHLYSKKIPSKKPVLRAFLGARTDDGMDYNEIVSTHIVDTDKKTPMHYDFTGSLENYPIPIVDPNDQTSLSGIMVAGIWNENFTPGQDGIKSTVEIQEIEFHAPYYTAWPPASTTSIFNPQLEGKEESVQAGLIIENFMKKAFRKGKVDATHLDKYFSLWKSIRSEHAHFKESIKEVLVAILCSSEFLFIAEPVSVKTENQTQLAKKKEAKNKFISDNEFVNRLSFFLWNSPPDTSLKELAVNGALGQEGTIEAQIQRMTHSLKSKRFIDSFFKEWLDMSKFDHIQIDVRKHPDFNRFIKRDMRKETLEYAHHILANNLPLSELISSDWTMLNENLAKFYGIEGVHGPKFRKVNLASGATRGGILSQGSFLAGHSSGDESHPIKRGVWVLEKILHDPPPPPPPNVPLLDEGNPDFEKLTPSQKLALHRDNPSCYSCHKKIDPYGMVFENYDAVGLWRDVVEVANATKPAESSVTLPDGMSVNGIKELKKYVVQFRKKDFVKSLTHHLTAYALGRSIAFTDHDAIDQIVIETMQAGGRFQDLLASLIKNPLFRQK